MCSNTLACPWWSLEGLLAAAQNWPISYQKVLVKTPQLVGNLVEPAVRGSGEKNVIFSNGPDSTSECFNLLY